jgi:hypothetical protein
MTHQPLTSSSITVAHFRQRNSAAYACAPVSLSQDTQAASAWRRLELQYCPSPPPAMALCSPPPLFSPSPPLFSSLFYPTLPANIQSPYGDFRLRKRMP